MVQYILMAVNAVMAATAVYFGIGFYRAALRDSAPVVESDLPAVQRAAAASTGANRTTANTRVITQRNLFNTDQDEAAPARTPVALEGLKPTKLQLVLHGTVTDDGDWAYAVIEDRKTRRQQLYRIGDPIQQAVIRMILPDRVVLTVDGGNEILEMEKVTATGRGTAAPPRIVARRGDEPGGSQPRVLPRALFAAAVEDPDGIMASAAMEAGMEGDTAIGVQLKTIQPASVFRRLGLRNGDIITAVNEQPVAGAEDLMRFVEELAAAESATMQIKRSNRDQTITFTIR